jgi:RNA polymerase sigma-70 factor, ECF subfamily
MIRGRTMVSFPYAEEFLAAASPNAPFAASDELEALLERLVAEGRAAWPDVALDSSSFVRHLGRHLPEDPEQLSRLHVTDLFLACACLHGNPTALAHFDRRFLSRIRTYLARLDSSQQLADEVRQLLSEKLFVTTSGTPKIAEYSGSGSLEGWVRVAAIRTGQNLIRASKPNVPLSDNDALALHDRAPSPELDYLRSRYTTEFSQALREALAEQPPKERNLLSLYFVDGLPSAAIGKLFGVHGATVRRWIEQTREKVLEATHKRLREQLKLAPAELESLMVLLQSQLDLTISHCLRRE